MKFGNQCIVVAIDAKKNKNSWEVFINGGRVETGIDAIQWAKKVEKLGLERFYLHLWIEMEQKKALT